MQYHTWARRKDMNAQEKLRKLRDCVRRWEASLQPEHMSTRRKAGVTADLKLLLPLTLTYRLDCGDYNPAV